MPLKKSFLTDLAAASQLKIQAQCAAITTGSQSNGH